MTRSKTSKVLPAIALVIVFIVPVIVAKFALDNNWFNRSVTNKGELLQPVIAFDPLLAEQPPKWRLLYAVPAECEKVCMNAIYSIHQVWLALGRETDRAEIAVLLSQRSDADTARSLREDPNIHTIDVDAGQLDQVLEEDAQHNIYLVDTLNDAMLRYPLHEERQQAVMESRDILADVKKLLKLSKIG